MMMKAIHVLFPLLVAIAMPQASLAGEARKADEGALYLHCFRPTYGQAGAASDRDEPNSGTPPVRLVSLKVFEGRKFRVMVGDKGHHLSGLLSRMDGSLTVDLQGAFGSGASYSGAIELEKVFDPTVTWFSGAVFPFRCVVSKQHDIAPFLKAQRELDAAKRSGSTGVNAPERAQ